MKDNFSQFNRHLYFKYIKLLLTTILFLASSFSYAERLNLLANPDFETQPLSQNWSVFGGAGTLSTSNVAHSGSSSAKVSNRTASYAGVSQNILGVLTPGQTYDVSAWVRLVDPVVFNISNTAQMTSIKFQINIKQTDASGTRYFTLDTSASENTSDWIKLFGQFTYVPNGTVSTLSFYVQGPAVGLDILVDDVAIYPPVSYSVTPHTNSDFVRAQGNQLVVGATGTPLRLMGVNFNAYGDESESASVVFNQNNYDETDYQRVAAMGLTVVRLNLWWKLFENESAPYSYQQAGWDWLNKNIVWARDAGVYLILDMHAPPGGFQGPGYSGTFWSNADQKNRTKALWSEIASRYQDEIVIAGYDLFNEPAPPTTGQLVSYTQELVDTIRAVDSHHLLIVETDYGNEQAGPFLVSDPLSNVMYDFHQYAPWTYSAALGFNYGYGDYGLVYPDANGYIQPWDWVYDSLSENGSIATGTSGWTWYEGQLFTPPNANVWGAMPVLVSNSNSGTVLFDDFVVDEFDAMGNFVRRIHDIDPDPKPSDWWMLYETHAARAPFVSYTSDWKGVSLSTGSSGTVSTSTTAHLGSKSLSLRATTGKRGIANTKLNFSVKQGHQYRISGWVKGTNVTGSGANLALRWMGFKSWDTPKAFTKASLENDFFDVDGLQFYLNANVPVNIGEFGTSTANFQDGRGGLAWVSDMLDIMDSYNINAQYFHYHSAIFGIYYNVFGYPNASHYNAALANLFGTHNYRN